VILCLVTDRRRLARPIPDLLDLARRAADAGIDLIQVRERDLDAAPLTTLVSQILEVTRGSNTRVVVNDRLDVAIAARAHGVHLRHDSIPIAGARALAAEPFVIGRSLHDPDEVGVTTGADYLVAGTVFPTPLKPAADALLGLDGLRAVTAAAAAPVLAIGGVTLERIPAIALAGAEGVAAISLFCDEQLVKIAADVRRRFDTARSAS
jgi:thiamine-phosphate pyrophosphorylase